MAENIPDVDTAVILARIETKLDMVIDKGKDHEDRLRALENVVGGVKKWPIYGALGLGGLGTSSGLWSLFGG